MSKSIKEHLEEKAAAKRELDKFAAENPILPPEETSPKLAFFRIDKRAKLPVRANLTDIGLDLFAHILTEHGRDSTKMIPRYNAVAIGTGLAIKPPPGYFAQICSRSGWALQGVFVANSPGTIAPDYTGEIKVVLYNGSHETKWISHGQRIAQLVIAPIISAEVAETFEPPVADVRGPAGFGSSGL